MPVPQVRCQIVKDGVACNEDGNHVWGTIVFCCNHFDIFVADMFKLKHAVLERQHNYFIQAFEKQTKQSSLAEGSKCDAEKKKP